MATTYRARESVLGTKRTNRAGLIMSVHRGGPEVAGRGRNGAFDPDGHGEPYSSRSSGAAIAFSTKADMEARRQAEAAQRDQAATAARRALEEAVKRNKAET